MQSKEAIPAAARLPHPVPPPAWRQGQLAQLRRLVSLQRAHGEQLNAHGRRLLAHAIFATYVDCREAGAEAAAAGILAGTEG